jgi:starch synthase (maltosyl-transferring)
MSGGMQRGRAPCIYNLFPRLAGAFDRWPGHLDRAAAMGFDWVYLNPIFYPGFSGSIYAVKDHRRLDPAILPDGAAGGLDEIAPVLAEARSRGLRPMVDLVVNHTARDCSLVDSHPEWYRRDASGKVESPWAIDPADARKRTVWGDLAELDFEGTPDPAGLVEYVQETALGCLEVGFEGFRCDAAYKVPSRVWQSVIGAVRSRRPGALFVAETLGCRIPEMMGLADAGFDYVMSSSKYWAFDAPWCLEQHASFQSVAATIAFPESHDTPRLAAETGGLVQVQRQRLAFAAWLSEGLLVPMGFELGFRRGLDVVRTRAHDWEEPSFDITGFVRDVLEVKRGSHALRSDGAVRALTPLDRPTLVLEKREAGSTALLLVNKDWHREQWIDPRPLLEPTASRPALARPTLFGPTLEPLPDEPLRLEPAEVAVVLQ